MSEDISKKINEVAQKLGQAVEDGGRSVMDTLNTTGKKMLDTFDLEKKKAEIRAEIGHNSRDLSKAYEKLGRDYFAARSAGRDLSANNETFSLIQSKEKVIELLNEKLDMLEKEVNQ